MPGRPGPVPRSARRPSSHVARASPANRAGAWRSISPRVAHRGEVVGAVPALEQRRGSRAARGASDWPAGRARARPASSSAGEVSASGFMPAYVASQATCREQRMHAQADARPTRRLSSSLEFAGRCVAPSQRLAGLLGDEVVDALERLAGLVRFEDLVVQLGLGVAVAAHVQVVADQVDCRRQLRPGRQRASASPGPGCGGSGRGGARSTTRWAGTRRSPARRARGRASGRRGARSRS